jgi:hypothetical protein
MEAWHKFGVILVDTGLKALQSYPLRRRLDLLIILYYRLTLNYKRLFDIYYKISPI